MKKIKYLIIIFFFHYFTANANDDFEHWLKEFSNKVMPLMFNRGFGSD